MACVQLNDVIPEGFRGQSMEHSHPVRRHDRSDRLGATESPMSSSSSSLLYAPDAFDVDVRALEVVLDLLVEHSDVTVEHRTKHAEGRLCATE